jgi:hypothetical protein
MHGHESGTPIGMSLGRTLRGKFGTIGEGMPRRPAKVTQADIARAIRAAKEAGAGVVIVDAQGNIRITLTGDSADIQIANGCDEIWTPSHALQRYRKRTESG